ncbi:MAG: hypothetical protein ACFWUG_23335 [Rahnella inusitata]
MTARGIVGRSNLALEFKRMAFSDHPDKAVTEQCLNADFRPHITQHAYLKIDPPFPQMRGAFFQLRCKTQTDPRRHRRHFSDKRCAKCQHKTVVRTQDKGAVKHR